MEHDGIAPRGELDDDLDREQHERRHERDDEREENDVGRRRAAYREELGVLAEDVEERLRERESRDGEQLRAAHRRLAEARCATSSAASRDRGCVFHSESSSVRTIRSARPARARTAPDRSRDARRPSCAEQRRHARIVARRELDHERRAQPREPGQELRHGHVPADRDVVQDGEAQRQLGPAARLERLPLEPVPAERRRRIGHVGDERQDRRLALRGERAVEAVDHGRVAVERDDVARVLGGDARVPSLVAADVPDEAPLARLHDLAHELFFARGVGLVVGRRRLVAGPLGRARLPLEPAHELVEPAHVGDDQLLLEAGALQLALDVAAESSCLRSSRACNATFVITPRRKRSRNDRSRRASTGVIPRGCRAATA